MDSEEVPVVKERGQAVNYRRHTEVVQIVVSALAKTSVEDILNAVGKKS